MAQALRRKSSCDLAHKATLTLADLPLTAAASDSIQWL